MMVKEKNREISPGKLRPGQVTREELQQLWLFDGVDLDSVIGLLNACPVMLLNKGDTLIAQGQDNHNCYLILSGKLHIHLDSPDNDAVSVLSPGESVGELSLLDGRQASAYVIGNEYCELLVLEEDIFWALVNASHDFSRNLLFLLTQRLRGNNATISESLKRLYEYKRTAIIDELTGLHNRRWMRDMLNRQINRNQHNNEPLSLMMIDVDHFKEFNDTYGHLSGDQVLRIVAKTMMNNIRPTDLLARYGGEEFIVVLPTTSLAGARIVANRMCTAVSKPETIAGLETALPAITISIGIAQMQENESMDELIKRADTALYKAKDNGRNRVED